MVKNSFLIPFLLSFCFVKFILGDECPVTDCNDYDTKKIITEVWAMPKGLSPMISEYRDILLKLSANSNDRQMNSILGQSLWANSLLTTLRAEEKPSCVFKNLLQQILKSTNAGEKTQAIKDFGELCAKAIRATRDVALQNAGCKPNSPVTPNIPGNNAENLCKVDNLLADALNSKDFEVRDELKGIIEKLVKSQDYSESTLGASAVLNFSSSVIDYMDKLMKSGNLLPHLKIYACSKQIPSSCCSKRNDDMNNAVLVLEKSSNDAI